MCIRDRLQSPGINPFFQKEEEIKENLKNHLSHFQQLPIKEIQFYGAGCAFPEKNQIVKNALENFFSSSSPLIEIQSDLLGAARALCQREAGIACIIGTGSNSCYYNGERIEHNVSPLGFILGDEGSGAVLGRQLVAECLKNQLPEQLAEKFRQKYSYAPSAILNRVYKQPFPNRFLASFTPFLAENRNEPKCRDILSAHFQLFLERNIKQYSDYSKLPIHFTGSVAYHFKEILSETAAKNGIEIGTIVKDPMERLVTYHSFDNVK